MSLRKTRKQVHFHAKQRWAVTIILLLIISVLLYGKLSTWNHVNTKYDHQEHREILASLKSEKDIAASSTAKNDKSTLVKPRRFNPNTVSVKELVSMGIKEKDAKSWTKYTSKGGKFYKAEDLKRLYSMTDELYEKLESFVDIPQSKKKEYSKKKSTYKKSKWVDYAQKKEDNTEGYASVDTTTVINKAHQDTEEERKLYSANFKEARSKRSSGVSSDFVISINETDSTELRILDGIGPVLSSRIIQYRDRLGGFHNMNQLLEVYGVKPALVSKIIDRINFDGAITQININTVQVKELVKHPYFDYPTANIFINYRSHHGDFKSIDDVKKIRVIKDYWLEETAPYFDFSPSKAVVSH